MKTKINQKQTSRGSGYKFFFPKIMFEWITERRISALIR